MPACCRSGASRRRSRLHAKSSARSKARLPDFLEHMYGAKPDRWDDALAGWDRLRVIVNAMTRMRFCDRAGRMDLKGGYAATTASCAGTRPAAARRLHAAFRPLVAARASPPGKIVGLDSGCVWGGALSALRLEDRTLYQVACPATRLQEASVSDCVFCRIVARRSGHRSARG